LNLSPRNAPLDGPTVVDSTAPNGLQFHFAEGAKPLATPWQIAIERAKLLKQFDLPDGIILDPACGSGIQLAAYCAILGKNGVGIELDESTAKAAASNIRRVAEYGFGENLLDSIIKVGDGRIADDENKVALLHLDPARPRNSQTHGLEEMMPQLPEIFSAWNSYLITDDKGPAILLDLSPRITEEQRINVEAIVEQFWPGINRTWVWTSRGRGRVDRLSLWLGIISSPSISRRFIRIPPDIKDSPMIIEGDVNQKPNTQRRPPRKGEYVSIIDSALVESGLSEKWFTRVLENQSITWGVSKGRRPQIHHENPFDFDSDLDRLLIQASGRIVGLIHSELNESTLPHLVEAAREYGFGKLTLRASLDPELQPTLQGSLDRQLSARGGPRRGFVAQQPGDSMLLLCVTEP
jgi:hypothetical protein